MREALGPATVHRLHAGLDALPRAEVLRAAFLVPEASAAQGSLSRAEPLAEELEPLSRFSWSELRHRLPSPPRLLTAQAADDLQDALREDLARLFGPVLAVELGIARAPGSDTVQAPAALLRAAFGSRDGLFKLFATYPVLARLCAILIDRWVGTAADLLTRLVVDRAVIGSLVRVGGGLPIVAGVTWGERPAVLGRPELVLHFAGGERVRYVPRPLPTHTAFARLVEWLNARGAPHPLRTARVVDRGTHGWVEHVQPQPCRDEDDVARFYQRAGAWAFLAWVLRAIDLGNQDLVACGSQPVLTRPRLLQHRLVRTPVGLLGHTVLSTGLIGSWRLVGRAFWDVSALPIGMRRGHCRVTASWSGLGTDAMRIQFRTVPVEVTDHLPHLDGRHEPASAHIGQLVQGFRDTFTWFVRHRERLLRQHGPLAELLSSPVEIAAYDQPAARLRCFSSAAPSLLHDSVAHRTAAETSSAQFLNGICDGLPGGRPLIAAEALAIANLSLPSLTARPDGTTLCVQQEDGTAWDLPGLLDAPSTADVRTRIQGLSPTECEEQARLLRIAIDEPRLAPTRRDPDDPATPSQGGGWIEEALALAEQLVNGAARTARGAPTWLAVTERPSRGLYQPTPSGRWTRSAPGSLAAGNAQAGAAAPRKSPPICQTARRSALDR